MRTIDTDWEWRNPQEVELEEHPPRRRPPARRNRVSARRRRPLLPTLTLFAAGAAAALSVVDIVTADVVNRPTQVIVRPADESPPPTTAVGVIDAPIIDTEDHPHYNPYVPPIGALAPTVEECAGVPLARGRPVLC